MVQIGTLHSGRVSSVHGRAARGGSSSRRHITCSSQQQDPLLLRVARGEGAFETLWQ